MPVAAITTAVSAGSSIAGGILGSNAANKASQEAQAAAQQGNQLISNQMSANSGYLSPFIQGGQGDFSALNALLGIGGNQAQQQAAFQNYLNSTNYKFMLDQGLNGIEYANAPAFSSSATAKALNNYAQGMAGNALGGYENMLMGGAGLGENAGSNLANINTGASEQQSANLLAAAGVQGSAGLASANALTNALHGVTSSVSSFMGGGGAGGLSSLFGSGAQGALGAATGGTYGLSTFTPQQLGADSSSALSGFNWG